MRYLCQTALEPVWNSVFGRNFAPLELLEKASGGMLRGQEQPPAASTYPCVPVSIQLAPSSGVRGAALYPLTAGPWSYMGEATVLP